MLLNAIEKYLSGGRLLDTGNLPDKGRLSCPVVADYGDMLAFSNLKVSIIKGVYPTIVLCQPLVLFHNHVIFPQNMLLPNANLLANVYKEKILLTFLFGCA